jgi:hypothetical protein
MHGGGGMLHSFTRRTSGLAFGTTTSLFATDGLVRPSLSIARYLKSASVFFWTQVDTVGNGYNTVTNAAKFL